MAKLGLLQTVKFKKYSRRLGMCDAHALGHLEMLWMVAHSAGHGRFAGIEDIEIAAGWCGDDGEFCATLVEVGFLDDVGEKYEIHDYREHCPKFVKDRLRKREVRQPLSATNGGQSATNGGHDAQIRRKSAPSLADPILADPILADPILSYPIQADPILADPIPPPPLANGTGLDTFNPNKNPDDQLALDCMEFEKPDHREQDVLRWDKQLRFWRGRIKSCLRKPGGRRLGQDAVNECRARDGTTQGVCDTKGYTDPIRDPAKWLNSATKDIIEGVKT